MNKRFQLNIAQLAAIVVVCLLAGFSVNQRFPGLVDFGRPATRQPDFSSLNSLYDKLGAKFDGHLDATKALEGAKAGMVAASGDPYTVYLSAKEAKELDDSLNGTLSGIGIEVGIKNNRLTVIAPVADTPAAKAGLKAGDVIAKIDDTDSSTLSLDQAVAKIRGPKGTQVKLILVRGSSQPQLLTITRDQITVPSVKLEMKSGNVGYVNISEFGTDTATGFDKVAKQMQAAGIKKVILDLRDNPGGYLDAAVNVASHFLPKDATVVQQRRGSTIIDTEKSTGGELQDAKVVVLINGGSASASEILAGALADNHRATLIGTTSFGKGSVQSIVPLNGGSQLKVTVAHWYTPSGRNITKEGIKPTKAVKLSNEDSDAGRDPQLDAAIKELQ